MTDLRIGGGAMLPQISPAATAVGEKSGKSFVDTLTDSVAKVENQQKQADGSINDLAVGRKETLHETMIAVEEADISFKMLLAVRSKLVNAYHEIMRMQF
ncbi:MAG: flagellar hook-basal body complex protein FliE [Pseudomonadota bacterium]